jgi:hypothetical protein
MKGDSDFDEILFSNKPFESRHGDELKQLIENIPYPNGDITITSYSEMSDNTPAKQVQRRLRNDNSNLLK